MLGPGRGSGHSPEPELQLQRQREHPGQRGAWAPRPQGHRASGSGLCPVPAHLSDLLHLVRYFKHQVFHPEAEDPAIALLRHREGGGVPVHHRPRAKPGKDQRTRCCLCTGRLRAVASAFSVWHTAASARGSPESWCDRSPCLLSGSAAWSRRSRWACKAMSTCATMTNPHLPHAAPHCRAVCRVLAAQDTSWPR